jgi:hypothetical protein
MRWPAGVKMLLVTTLSVHYIGAGAIAAVRSMGGRRENRIEKRRRRQEITKGNTQRSTRHAPKEML